MGKWSLKKSDLKNNSVFLTLDCGSVLVKCLYIDYEDDTYNTDGDNDSIIFTSQTSDLLKAIGDFLENIKSRKTQIGCFQSKSIFVSGFQAETFKKEIRKILECEVKIIPEMQAIADGLRFLKNQTEQNAFIYLPEVVDPFSKPITSKYIERMKASWEKKMDSGNVNAVDKEYPILYVSVGATTRFFQIDPIDHGYEVSYETLGGNILLGLAKCLLDDNNFQSIIKLAEMGNRRNVDTQFHEILIDVNNTPYGTYPPELPFFSFGKAMEIGPSDNFPYTNQDIANSLISMILETVVSSSLRVCLPMKCKSIYFGGSLFQHNVFRKEYSRYCQRLPRIINIHFLKDAIETTIGLLLQNIN